MTVVNLSGGKVVDKTVADFFEENKQESGHYNAAIVIMINNKEGHWQTKWASLNLDPTEVNFSLDLTKSVNLEAMRR